MTFFTLICCAICKDVCLKRPKNNEKEARVGPFFIKKALEQGFILRKPSTKWQTSKNKASKDKIVEFFMLRRTKE